MPLKLHPPRAGKSKNWSIRGTYLGIRVDKSCGTDKRPVALRVLKRLEEQIERGEYGEAEAPAGRPAPTFLTAARKYLEAGGTPRYISSVVGYFGETPLSDIDQDAIDECAKALRPNTVGATKNRCVYTPISSVLKHAGIEMKIKRPLDAKAQTRSDALSPEDAAAIIAKASFFDAEYGLLLRFLLYTGCRLGEALGLKWDDVRLSSGTATIRMTKNGEPRAIKIRADLCSALMKHQRHDDGRVFRFRPGGNLKHKLVRAKLAALGLPCPKRRPKGWEPPKYRLAWANHHTFRHTWATWMRQYGGLDITGLKATGNWKDERSASRYIHAKPREEWSRVEALPDVDQIASEQAENKVHVFSTS